MLRANDASTIYKEGVNMAETANTSIQYLIMTYQLEPDHAVTSIPTNQHQTTSNNGVMTLIEDSVTKEDHADLSTCQIELVTQHVKVEIDNKTAAGGKNTKRIKNFLSCTVTREESEVRCIASMLHLM